MCRKIIYTLLLVLLPGTIPVNAQETGNSTIDIIMSGYSAKAFTSVDFDCALATQNMYIAAQSLGLGAHIYGSPAKDINSTKKQALGIPDDYRAVTILRIGHIDKNVDATSSASSRKKMEDMVNYK